jgi:signal transduction histidine kinase
MNQPGKTESGPIQSSELAKARLPRYRRLRRNAVIVTCLVALTPLAILTFINFLQDREAYRAENRYAVYRILSNTKRTLDLVIEERRSVISLILRDNSYNDLSSDASLKTVLNNLNDSFGGFIDLGLIDSDGIQTHYAGPYELKGKNYKDQDWFQEVLLRGIYVSDVFLGYRDLPHFVIAFKTEKEDGDFYILRATIDMELITKQIYSLELDRTTDAFVIDKDGILQTGSFFHGNVLEKVDLEIPSHIRSREVIEERGGGSHIAMFGYAQIKDTPFILVAEMRLETPLKHWLSRRSVLIWFFTLSAIPILFVIIYFANNMVKQLREADLRRAKVFHNVEYTNKLATIGRMAAGVAHEINNPLAIINEKAGLIKDMASFNDDFPHKEKTIKLVDSVLNSVERCSRVTHRLLGFARRMDARKELIDIRSLLEEVVGFQTTEVAHRNIIINYDIPDDLPSIESDRGLLQQIFLNLVNNAIAAVPDGGQIDIAANKPSSNTIEVIIKDNGPGIPKENLEHIFEPFFSTKGEFGTGLGLSITHDIVENLGGRISVESEMEKGTIFAVSLLEKRVDYGG